MDEGFLAERIRSEAGLLVGDVTVKLNELRQLADDSYDLEALLARAVKSLYGCLPNGEQNYLSNSPEVAQISMRRGIENGEHSGKVEMIYYPGRSLNMSVSPHYFVEIFLKEREYSLREDTPSPLKEDTESVMAKIGLKKTP